MPTPTPTPTPSIPIDTYSFRDCCNSYNVFNFNNVTASLSVGQTFYISGGAGDFEGCTELISYDY